MNIVNVRVDSRGIHGQVATAWAKGLEVNRIMVIDDQAILSEMSKMTLKMACPSNVKLSILSCEKASVRLADENNYVGEKILVLLMDVKALEKLAEFNCYFKEVNLGNVSNKKDSLQIAKTVYLSNEEIEVIKKQIQHGTSFYHQMVPTESKQSLNEEIQKA